MTNLTIRVFMLFLIVLQLLVRVRSIEEDLEIVILPTEWSINNATVPLRFSAFGKHVDLLLKRNEQLIAPNFEVWKSNHDESSRINDYANYSSCHYLHENSYSSAAVSLCDAGMVQGFVFLENDSLEITPLSKEECSELKVSFRTSGMQAHAIKRRRISTLNDAKQKFNWLRVRVSPRAGQETSSSSIHYDQIEPAATASAPTTKNIVVDTLTIELALFFDETAYKTFKPHLSGSEDKIIDLLLAYVNNIQALYHHPSLGQRIDLSLVRLELMQSQPRDLAHLDGERNEVLEAFCKYSDNLNPNSDDDPKHWDMGLYVSGLDFYAIENGTKNPVTMGLAPVGGVCWNRYACVIAEFGVYNKLNRPFPSAGFTSVYIAAHEMGHNLGMHHDSSGNDCPKDGYIMSPSRGVNGETQWSKCSRDVALSLATGKNCLHDKPRNNYLFEPQLDHQKRFNELPGRHWSAKRQCELLLRDHDAFVETLNNSCNSLKCKTPRKTGLFLAGPALDGTKCDKDKECHAGDCLPIKDNWETEVSNGWSDWRDSSCESGCIRGSRGFIERYRTCLINSQCPGLSFDVNLCKDSEICEGRSRKRLSIDEHAGLRCLEFKSRGISIIDSTAVGLQATYEVERPWISCVVFCKRMDIASYYTPRDELNSIGVDPYFPDGTWCHHENGQDYFCRKHHCLPENFRFGKSPLDVKDDLDFSAKKSYDFRFNSIGRPTGPSV